MDGSSYQNPILRTSSPLTPARTGSPASAYQTNVHRTKTRKWVEAKKQTYDGDDWGNEFDDEDDADDEPPPMPEPASARSFSQPAGGHGLGLGLPGYGRNEPSGLRKTSGPPDLHLETRPSALTDSARFGSGRAGSAHPSERVPASEQLTSSQSGVYAPTPSHPGRPPYQPRSADPSPRYPPRKSSMSRHEPNSQPQSPDRSAGAPARPSPFPRPSEIYARMEEEERERRSTDSNKARIDNAPGNANADAGMPRGSRQSGYGLKSLGGTQTATSGLSPNTSRLSRVDLPPPSTMGQGKDRRVSVSPQLPDVARLSGFGDDFLTPGSRLETPGSFSGVETQPEYFVDSPRPLYSAEAPAPLPGVDTPKPLLATRGVPDQAPPSVLEGPALGDGEVSTHTRPSTERQSRPSIPGGWISEYPNVDSARPTPMEQPDQRNEAFRSLQNNEISPPSDDQENPDDIEPTTKPRQVQSLDHTPNVVAKIHAKYDSCSDGFGNATGTHDENVTPQANSNGGPHLVPQDLPPLQTPKPLAPATDGFPSALNRIKSPQESYKDSPSIYSSNTRETTNSEFSPTAPLNPRRSMANPPEFVAPGMPPRYMTMSDSSVDTSSPGNEADRLREDIIRSLSPGALPGDTPRGDKNETGESGRESAGRQRRFSWDRGPEQVTLSPVDEPSSTPFGPDAYPSEAAPNDNLRVDTGGAGTLSHQVSALSVLDPGGLEVVEAPSPASAKSGESNSKLTQAPAAGNEERSLNETSPRAMSPSSSQGEHPPFASPMGNTAPMSDTLETPVAPTPIQPKIMTFREILSLPSIEHRTDKFDEARMQHVAMDPGLDNWNLHMMNQIDLGNAPITSVAFADLPTPGLAPAQAQPSSADPSGQQQPYYQQYLNASNPGLEPGPPARSSTLQGQLSSGFGPGGSQVGTKSKELLNKAGVFGNKATKSGMKLFSKGKSKLRSKGDKVFS